MDSSRADWEQNQKVGEGVKFEKVWGSVKGFGTRIFYLKKNKEYDEKNSRSKIGWG